MRITEIKAAGKASVRTDGQGHVHLRLPIAVIKRSAHKRIVGPAPTTYEAETLRLTPFQLALILGNRWLGMLERGEAASIKELARLEKTDPSRVSRLINLTVLSPTLTSQILRDQLASNVTLFELAIATHPAWSAMLV